MLKTIKKNVHMRLDELIKYVRENKKTLFEEHVAISFKTKDNKGVIFANNGNFVTGEGDCINIDDLFEVEIEEKITEDTVFDKYVVLLKGGIISTPFRAPVKAVMGGYYTDIESVYALIDDNKLELVWEAQDNNGEK